MNDSSEETNLTKLESILALGVVGCLLLATWELCHLLKDTWFPNWVAENDFVHKRIIYYGVAFAIAIPVMIVSVTKAFTVGRFAATLIRALLWYGVILLITAIAVFVFDCLPEVVAGITGAIFFAVAIYMVQRKFFTKERVAKIRLQRGRCMTCDVPLHSDAAFCSGCGGRVGQNCPSCASPVRLPDPFCWKCGQKIKT
jgi:uncharacterized membrane protein YdjX (TVP38/TMEM64 family)